ncbi:hypothetical protein A3F19_01040 [Candidatus Nomurabacteria bacterium RIFCSPHIGHO2_12_FULL_37_29]|uniref:Bacterial spore germination immunoglobulin-like domain-containing protein n=2 Tax=Parcubacteria group TaxID=1794811 RepID=A0A1F6WB20_9BACT|nr:MAG: hypothetical protein A2727_01650 [Candidatus Nomurabacteria bacterium RIFCSPHIGHO2_01_FULL_37_110]OGI79074.1 MAG: hypothetical protein A3F19_01040 [Candidatus Nomurabacteria bacterium RIFCSPHIGHO2_12_FULL_37_29]OGI84345.1 MAG: hypothetical protein A3A92_02115 [Candidatus Nomurabacteria bacterium RIFCSPLOWO2_01_FULL_37_49]OGY61588.1 MAG: hypothetical protein A3H06_02610 [Candidatus Colwellbacteria bacterium RIFCSPLOWO2_12_FULL_44_13]
MNRFFGSKLNTVLLVALIILMVIALKVMFKNKDTYINPLFTDKTEEEINTVGMLGKKEDLVSFSIVPGAKMPNSILSYRGEIKDGWFFEGNILINILDKDKKVIKASNAMAKTDWMTAEAIEFEGNIDFTGLPKGPAYFEIHNDNASGLPENDKSILIPVVI